MESKETDTVIRGHKVKMETIPPNTVSPIKIGSIALLNRLGFFWLLLVYAIYVVSVLSLYFSMLDDSFFITD